MVSCRVFSSILGKLISEENAAAGAGGDALWLEKSLLGVPNSYEAVL